MRLPVHWAGFFIKTVVLSKVQTYFRLPVSEASANTWSLSWKYHISWLFAVGGAYLLRMSTALVSGEWSTALLTRVTANYWLKGYVPVAALMLAGHVTLKFLTPRRLKLFAYYSLWIGMLYRRLSMRAQTGSQIASRLQDRLFDCSRPDLIAASGDPVPPDYSFWSRMQGRPQDKPSVVRRQDLTAKSFWPNWAFAEVLVFNDLKLSCLQNEHSREVKLKVDLREQDLGLYNNTGKQFLHEHFLTDRRRDRLAEQSEHVNAFLGDASPGDTLTVDTADAPFRWASAGVLPIVRWQQHWWYALYFRGIPPVGWNLAVGGSESEAEYLDLHTLTLREFCEETVLLDRTPEPDHPHDLRQKTFRPEGRLFDELPEDYRHRMLGESFSKQHRRLRKQQDQLAFETIKGPTLQTISTPFSVEIHSENTTRTVDNIIFSVNPHEFGVEVISPYAFEMAEDDTLMFGEVGEAGSCPLRQPIMLLSTDYVDAALTESGGFGRPITEYPYSDCQRFEHIPSHAYHLFDADIDIRARRVRKLQRMNSRTDAEEEELSLHTGWFDRFGSMFEEIRTSDSPIHGDRQRPAATLCPVTWKTLASMHAHDVRLPKNDLN